MRSTADFGLEHLDSLCDHRGLFEHAKGTVRRREHGRCTDDNARMLVVSSREPDTGLAQRLSRLALHFVLDAQDATGRSCNRMDNAGMWADVATTEDCWGRSLWGLGVAATQHPDPGVRQQAMGGFDTGIQVSSRWSRALAFAALGAAEVRNAFPDHVGSKQVLTDALEAIEPPRAGTWAWPESRLRYANAALAEAVIAAGAALGSQTDIDRGLTMLEWLLTREMATGHLSVTAIGGEGPEGRHSEDRHSEGRAPGFDQQPIEVAAMADACWRAYSVTGDETWTKGISAAADWFTGDNDAGVVMYDDISGGGYDGLQAHGANLNEGAESTLALISTMQRARSFTPV